MTAGQPRSTSKCRCGPGREAGRALQPQHRARRHLIAIADQHRLQVRVADPEVAYLDLDVVAEAAPVAERRVRLAQRPTFRGSAARRLIGDGVSSMEGVTPAERLTG